jgi:hypothetical protein
VLQRTEAQIQQSHTFTVEDHLPRLDYLPPRGGFGFGGVVFAAVVGLALAYAPYPALPADSVDFAVQELVVSLLIRTWGTFMVVSLILSVGRRPIDIQLARSMIVAFVFGFVFGLGFVAIFLGFQIPTHSQLPVILLPVLEGAIFAVTLGPAIFVAATLANLLWYRSLSAMKPWLVSRRAER